MSPNWRPNLTAWVLRIGMRRALTTLTCCVWVLTMLVCHSLISLTGLGNRWLASVGATLCVLSMAPTLSYICFSLLIDLDRARRRLQRYAALDDLTGIYNRRHVLNSLEREWSRAQRYNFGCSVVLIDVDRFKSINDSFGHVCGDVFLQQMANEIEETLRLSDVLGRFGGEEFIVFLPHTDALGAVDAAERVRKRIEELDFCWNGHAVNISISLGVAAKRADHASLAHLIQEADGALQAAKEAGRNCVRCGNGPQPGRVQLYSL
jgi:diguanylate cyclase